MAPEYAPCLEAYRALTGHYPTPADFVFLRLMVARHMPAVIVTETRRLGAKRGAEFTFGWLWPWMQKWSSRKGSGDGERSSGRGAAALPRPDSFVSGRPSAADIERGGARRL